MHAICLLFCSLRYFASQLGSFLNSVLKSVALQVVNYMRSVNAVKSTPLQTEGC